MTLRFSDGMEFDTSGPLRTEERADGWYVIGEGMLCAVTTEAEGQQIILDLTTKCTWYERERNPS
jgi:hypothetical protein